MTPLPQERITEKKEELKRVQESLDSIESEKDIVVRYMLHLCLVACPLAFLRLLCS